MILGPISLIDCLVFCGFLLPQLFWDVGVIQTFVVAVKALPFLCSWFLTPSLRLPPTDAI